MRVQDLQLFLSNFTKGIDAVKNAVIYVEINGKLHAIRRMEVHENATPIIGQPGHSAHRLVMKTEKPSSLILPDKASTGLLTSLETRGQQIICKS